VISFLKVEKVEIFTLIAKVSRYPCLKGAGHVSNEITPPRMIGTYPRSPGATMVDHQTSLSLQTLAQKPSPSEAPILNETDNCCGRFIQTKSSKTCDLAQIFESRNDSYSKIYRMTELICGSLLSVSLEILIEMCNQSNQNSSLFTSFSFVISHISPQFFHQFVSAIQFEDISSTAETVNELELLCNECDRSVD
jgi:hypothetical protein